MFLGNTLQLTNNKLLNNSNTITTIGLALTLRQVLPRVQIRIVPDLVCLAHLTLLVQYGTSQEGTRHPLLKENLQLLRDALGMVVSPFPISERELIKAM